MGPTRVEWHDRVWDELVDGPIADHMEDIGEDVATRAERRVRRRTGYLASTIRVEQAVEADSAAADVSADAENNGFPYAVALEAPAVQLHRAYPFLTPALEEIDG